jgi:pimeloyl-ACP methyl ester carboxylesterase
MKPRMRLAGLIALPLLGYVSLCGWMYARQHDLMYYPQLTRADAEGTDFGIARNGVMLNGWLVNIGKPNAIIYFGGNAERIEDMRDEFARWFPDSSIYLVPYRGYGASEGTPSEPVLLEDALAVYDQVRARQPGAPITLIGRSLGSGVASYVASQRPVSKLVLVTPFDSMANVAQAHYRWLPVRWLARDRYESVRHLANYAGPVLVIRAGRDRVIPAASTDRLIAALARPPRVVNLPGADHGSIDADPAYAAAMAGFVAARSSP